jgi:hypothetical protein
MFNVVNLHYLEDYPIGTPHHGQGYDYASVIVSSNENTITVLNYFKELAHRLWCWPGGGLRVVCFWGRSGDAEAFVCRASQSSRKVYP